MLFLFRLFVMSLNVWSDHLTVVRWTEVRVLEYTHRFVYCVYVLVYNSDVDKSLRGSYTRDGYKLNVRRTSTCSGRIKDLLFVFSHFLGDLFGTLMATWRWWWNEFIALKDLFENKYQFYHIISFSMDNVQWNYHTPNHLLICLTSIPNIRNEWERKETCQWKFRVILPKIIMHSVCGRCAMGCINIARSMHKGAYDIASFNANIHRRVMMKLINW